MNNDANRASLELLYNISRELATALDLHTVLTRVLFLSIGNVNAERGSLIVLNENGIPVDAAIVFNNQLIAHTAQQLQATLDHGLAGWVVRHRQPVLVADTGRDERWLLRPDDAVERTGAKSAICLPLMAREHLVGVMTIVHPKPHFFKKDHLALLQAIADQAGIAISNALLYDSLQAATRRYRELFENSIDPIFITNWSGQILEANRPALHASGYSLEELLSRSIFDLHDGSPEKLHEEAQQLNNGQTLCYEALLERKGKDSLPVEVYVRKVQTGGEAFLQWTLRDISARKELDSLREDLNAMVYHDLRSPLANIVSSLDMMRLLLNEEENHSVDSLHSIAMRATERMQRLIDTLLDVYRLEAGQPIVHLAVVNTAEMVQEAMEAIRPVVENKQQTLQAELAENLPPVQADTDMIKRVLINLLDNAAKFTPERGLITCGGEFCGGYVQLWVQDSGPGIAPEAQVKIFNKFARHEDNRFSKGFGLGLAFCRLAVEAHGGQIWVESRQGGGSRFIFTLPAATPA